ncbi:hypothetical protein BHE90_012480 [Fusarium euwallaceae]|uniref:Fungal N-terminal domain-containing protein n=1 Tax=Fusarium euwallaceae TaxID=1147111 RepID=A0A430LBM0_9HYPO|nr:hypothetical protein BHE90_012480 [Fusarium euwallaceae]
MRPKTSSLELQPNNESSNECRCPFYLRAFQLDKYKAVLLTKLLRPASQLLGSGLSDDQLAPPPRMDMAKYSLRDFQDHLDPIETRVGSTMPPSVTSSTTELYPIKHDRERTEKCLQTCAEVLCCIDAAQLQLLSGRTTTPVEQSSSDSSRGLSEAHLITAAALQECGHKLNQTLSQLYIHMEKINMELSVSSSPTEKNLAIRNHDTSSKRSLVLGNVSVGKDGRQTIVCAAGDVLEVKQATVGDRAVQFIGSACDAKAQERLKNHGL